MVNNILKNLAADTDYYKKFHIVNLLQDTEGYFKFGNYCDSTVETIVTVL